jgi:hypothetical protein
MGNHTQTLPARENYQPKYLSTDTSSIENGGFETGDFEYWNTIGDTSIETEDLGIYPPEGTYQALITNGYSDAGGSVIDSDLEEFLDLAPGSLDNLVHGDATEGSFIKQTFTAEAGDVVSFDWNFLTNEATPSETFNDTAFLTVNGFTFELADTGSDFVHANHVDGFEEQTGTQNLKFSIAQAGTYTIGFGVVDVGDDIVDSGLIIDNVAVEQPYYSHGINSYDDSGSGLTYGEGGFTYTDGSLTTESVSGWVLDSNGFEMV